MAIAETLLTAEEYRLMPDNGAPTELVRGKIVPMNMPTPRHGQVCANVVFALKDFLRRNDLGHVVSNDSGVITEHEPDTVRGPDVAFYSYASLPKGPLPASYVSVAPELVFEVRSPGDRWRVILKKVTEYLNAGVAHVCVLDPERECVFVYTPDDPEVMLSAEHALRLSPVLPGFEVPVRELFD